MPYAVVYAVYEAVLYYTGNVIVAYAAAAIAAYAIYSQQKSSLPNPGGTLAGSQTVEYSGTTEPRRIIYGQNLVSGMNVVPPWCHGSKNEILDQVLALAGHEVYAITDVYFNQTLIPSASITGVTGVATDGLVFSGTYVNNAYIRKYTGTSTQAADYILKTAWPSYWTTNHRGRGIAYLAIKYIYDPTVYSNGKPEVRALVQGKLVYDPRLDTSPGANPTGLAYKVFSSNPALCIADYIMDADLGVGEDPARIDWTMVVAAANSCEELVSIPGPATQYRFTCNVVLDCTETYEHNLGILQGAMLGHVTYSGGKWRMYAGVWRTSSFAITDDDLIGSVQLTTAIAYQNRFNAVRGQFMDAANYAQPTEYPPIRVSADEIADGEGPIWRDQHWPTCTNTYEAQRNAIIVQRQSRRTKSWSLQCAMSAYDIRPGDIGSVTLAELGITAQVVQCVGWSVAQNGTVMLSLQETNSADFTDPATGVYQAQGSIAAPAPANFVSDPVTGFTATGIGRAIQFAWTLPTTWYSKLQVEILEAPTNNIAGATAIWTGVNSAAVIAKSDYTTRYYWAQIRNTFGNTVSATMPAGATSGLAAAAIQVALTDMGANSVDTGNIVANAASQMVSNYSATRVACAAGGQFVLTEYTVISATMTCTGSPVAIDIGCSCSVGGPTGSSLYILDIQVYRDGASISSSVWDATDGSTIIQFGNAGLPAAQVSVSATDSPSVGSHTYSMHLRLSRDSTTGGISAFCRNNFIKLREIKR